MQEKAKLWSVLSYITWIGWIVAYVKWDRQDTLVRRHLNQALVLNVISTVASLVNRIGHVFAFIGGIADIVCLVLFIMGIVRAAKMSDEPLPVIGEIQWIQ